MSRVITRFTSLVASLPVTKYLYKRRDVDQRGRVADGVVLVLVMHLVNADRVIARPLAVIEALAERESSFVKCGSYGHGTLLVLGPERRIICGHSGVGNNRCEDHVFPVSKLVMQGKRRGRLLTVSPLVIVIGFYLFLISANYYYAKRAAYVLHRIGALKIDNSSIAELKRLGSEHGLRYEEADNCASMPCIHWVSPNNGWMLWLLRSPATARLGDSVGLRAWWASGDILVDQNQTVTGKAYGVAFFGGRLDPEIEATAWEEHKFELDCSYYALKRHPGYGFRGASNIRSFRAITSESTSTENREHAFQFNLNCLTGWHRCDQFSELMPAAWADFEEDKKWWETHRDSSVGQTVNDCSD